MEQLFPVVFAAVLGGVFGSFANVLVLRWHEDASIMGRSRCPNCRQQIRIRHLIPVVSWFLLRGKCAACDKNIHVQYPLVEAACVILGVIAALRFDPFGLYMVRFWFEFIISVGLVVPVVMDIRWKEIPVEYIVGLSVIAYAFQIAFASLGWEPFGDEGLVVAMVIPIFAAAIPVAFFGIQYLVSRGRWIGAGDIWFGAMMGFILGTPQASALGLYIGYLFGGMMALIGLASGQVKRRSRLPFAPALAAGTMVALWYGDSLIAFITR